ncbi:hypothetical protein [Pedobacter duraquae]|uniref:Acyl carrier protein phosphodiesterase n=1 Tax=Pedobacter duraquae TaxID=425511 RepID=A0A4R6IM69_9SPHI|nr:hypothetical protein [Pedobacter duraquae]TDO23086.1 hypothetical protein CLV32_2073 [Pedobacter duraquae]
MNFLSHYYFERNNPDYYMVLGVVLPDLVKNAHKDWNLNPQKSPQLFSGSSAHMSLLKGWEKHLEADRIFHSSAFFKIQTAALKQHILPVLTSGPVKPFFLAHIGLELILDHLLSITTLVNVDTFYQQLTTANAAELDSFLTIAGIPDLDRFKHFLSEFIKSRYLLSYQKSENITYALNRICMRLWANPLTDIQLQELTIAINSFKEQLASAYLSIFVSMESELSMKTF